MTDIVWEEAVEPVRTIKVCKPMGSTLYHQGYAFDDRCPESTFCGYVFSWQDCVPWRPKDRLPNRERRCPVCFGGRRSE